MKVLLIDINKCNGCYNCQIACKDEHVGNDWTPIAKPQPNTGHFWLKITDVVQGSVPKVRVRYMHDICQHCDEAPCIKACKSNAVYRREDGIVIIDPDKCTGNRNCLDACPYKTIYFNADLNIAQKCTMCAHLLDEGWKEPRCVDACPTGALVFGEEEDLKDLIADAEILHPEYGTRPRVYYKGIPNKYFMAGSVYDPDADEVLEGAKISLTNKTTCATSTITTDLFGDFWFERQEPGIYQLKIEMDGYTPVVIDDLEVTKDINVGDFELRKG
jgi:tetrathionate reductase subunit B